MFIGHFGVGFGAKPLDCKVSLGTFFLAAQFIDLLWPTLVLLGLETVSIVPGITRVMPLDFTSYPISHSLLMVCLWGLLFGGIYWLVRRNKRGAVILGLCVVSHWALDLLVHRPDLPLFPGDSPKVGLGLWNSLPGSMALEALVFGLGVFLYLRSTRARNRRGAIALWSLVVFLVVLYLGNTFGSPPPSVAAIAWLGHLQWLFIIWAYWIDRNRTARA